MLERHADAQCQNEKKRAGISRTYLTIVSTVLRSSVSEGGTWLVSTRGPNPASRLGVVFVVATVVECGDTRRWGFQRTRKRQTERLGYFFLVCCHLGQCYAFFSVLFDTARSRMVEETRTWNRHDNVHCFVCCCWFVVVCLSFLLFFFFAYFIRCVVLCVVVV